MNLQRSLERWLNAKASAVVDGSKAQVMYFVEDAQKDIAALHTEIERLTAENRDLRSGEYLLRVIEEREALRKQVNQPTPQTQARATDSFGRDLIERELVSIVLRMSRHLQAVDTPAAKKLDAGALDYLRRKGLMPFPLRADETVVQSGPSPETHVAGESALRSALEFYAAPENWTEPNQVNSQELFDTAMGLDLGARAREALASHAPSPVIKQWQPIETAPKDGRHVILYCEYYGVGRCAWESWRKVWRSDDPNHGIGFPQPTHWMPLPDYPEGSVRAENARRAALAATTEGKDNG